MEEDLTVVLGPVKSGKSLELISQFAPLQYSDVSYKVYQSARHGRAAMVVSRSGATLSTTKVLDLSSALDEELSFVAVDEVHMFARSDVDIIRELLLRGTRVVAAGIDLDHRSELFDIIKGLLELAPSSVIYRRAVCEVCKSLEGAFTQVLLDGVAFTKDIGGEALPDDGSGRYTYQARCRRCLVLP